MKKIEIVIDSSGIDKMKACFEQVGIFSFFLSTGMRYDAEKKEERSYRGATFQKKFQELTKVEAHVNDEQMEKIIECLTKEKVRNTLFIHEAIVYDTTDVMPFILK